MSNIQEQKLADVANCLSDVLKCADGDTSEPFHQGREYLFALFNQLSRMRGMPSRYLQPLLEKTGSLQTQIPAHLPSMIGWDAVGWNSHSENDGGAQVMNIPSAFFHNCMS